MGLPTRGDSTGLVQKSSGKLSSSEPAKPSLQSKNSGNAKPVNKKVGQGWKSKGPGSGHLARESPKPTVPGYQPERGGQPKKKKAYRIKAVGKAPTASALVVRAAINDVQKLQGEVDALRESAKYAKEDADSDREAGTDGDRPWIIDVPDDVDMDQELPRNRRDATSQCSPSLRDGDESVIIDVSDDDVPPAEDADPADIEVPTAKAGERQIAEGGDDLDTPVLVYVEHAMMNLHYRFHEGGGLLRALLKFIIALFFIFLITKLLDIWRYLDVYQALYDKYGAFVLPPLLWSPGSLFFVAAPVVMFALILRDVLKVRSGLGATTFGLPVRHTYTAVAGSLKRVGCHKWEEWANLRCRDLRWHALSQADLKLLNALEMDVQYRANLFYFLPVCTRVMKISGEVLAQTLLGKNIVASTDYKATALRMETFANSLQVINMNRYETLGNVHRVPDSIRVAYAAYRQYMEERMVVPFPYHPSRN